MWRFPEATTSKGEISSPDLSQSPAIRVFRDGIEGEPERLRQPGGGLPKPRKVELNHRLGLGQHQLDESFAAERPARPD